MRDAIGFFGSQAALAKALAVTPMAVGQWASPGVHSRRVPPKQCVRIEALTEGRVTRRQLRPDDWADFWPELANSKHNSDATPAHQARVAINSEVKEGAHG